MLVLGGRSSADFAGRACSWAPWLPLRWGRGLGGEAWPGAMGGSGVLEGALLCQSFLHLLSRADA